MYLVFKAERERPLGGPRRRWEDDIDIDVGGSGQGPVESPCGCGNEAGKYVSSYTAVFTRSVRLHADS
jgi:hypothetical protein